MQDLYGRTIRYLRLSLTSACQMRCAYCRPAFVRQPRQSHHLTPQECAQLVRRLVDHHGLRKVRLTGGDPTARPDLIEIIRQLSGIVGLDDLAMTTNGLTLHREAQRLAEAGLQRLNISLDSLDAEQFKRITGVDGLERVMKGIEAVVAAGLTPIKLNTVVMRGENESQLPALVEFAVERGLDLRFIELMPMGPLADRWADRYVPESQMRRILAQTITHWRPLPQASESARRYRVTTRSGLSGTVGFITPMSCNFCSACNRLRITSDGGIYPCLMGESHGSIMPAVRPTFDGALLDSLLQQALATKAAEHPEQGAAVMTHIGG